jgi:hypothetical protein
VQTALELALMAIEPNANPLDADMSGVGSDPTDLDLDDAEEAEICSKPRRSRPAADACIICRQSPCDDYA